MSVCETATSELRWLVIGGVTKLQYKVRVTPISGDVDDEEILAYIEKNGEWRDVPSIHRPHPDAIGPTGDVGDTIQGMQRRMGEYDRGVKPRPGVKR